MRGCVFLFSKYVDKTETLLWCSQRMLIEVKGCIWFFQRMLIIQFLLFSKECVIIQFLFPRKSYSSNSLLSKFFHLSRKDSLGIYKDGVVDVDGVAVDVGITSADTWVDVGIGWADDTAAGLPCRRLLWYRPYGCCWMSTHYMNPVVSRNTKEITKIPQKFVYEKCTRLQKVHSQCFDMHWVWVLG